jgi:hypothetical protein
MALKIRIDQRHEFDNEGNKISAGFDNHVLITSDGEQVQPSSVVDNGTDRQTEFLAGETGKTIRGLLSVGNQSNPANELYLWIDNAIVPLGFNYPASRGVERVFSETVRLENEPPPPPPPPPPPEVTMSIIYLRLTAENKKNVVISGMKVYDNLGALQTLTAVAMQTGEFDGASLLAALNNNDNTVVANLSGSSNVLRLTFAAAFTIGRIEIAYTPQLQSVSKISVLTVTSLLSTVFAKTRFKAVQNSVSRQFNAITQSLSVSFIRDAEVEADIAALETINQLVINNPAAVLTYEQILALVLGSKAEADAVKALVLAGTTYAGLREVGLSQKSALIAITLKVAKPPVA